MHAAILELLAVEQIPRMALLGNFLVSVIFQSDTPCLKLYFKKFPSLWFYFHDTCYLVFR